MMPNVELWPVALTAIPIGFAFGVILEQAGLGDSRVIRGQLLGEDWTVVLVMFGAIVTAMLGMLWAQAFGAVDLSIVGMPPTDIGGQILGAIVFGGGFGIAALCPGTACVAAASGRRDGLAAVGGVLIGTLLTTVIWPIASPVVSAVPDEQRQLMSDLHLPTWLVALGIVVMLLVASRCARFGRNRAAWRQWWRLSSPETAALILAVGYATVEDRPHTSSARVAALAATISREEDHVDAIELARWIKEGRPDLRVFDVRDGVDSTMYMIPGAQLVPLDSLATIAVAPSEFVVLYSDGGAHAAQGWVLLRMRGIAQAAVLHDGLAAWEDEILQPVLPSPTDSAGKAFVSEVRRLSLWFGGQPRVDGFAPTVTVPGRVTPMQNAAKTRRRRTC